MVEIVICSIVSTLIGFVAGFVGVVVVNKLKAQKGE